MPGKKIRILYFVTEDWYFLSHRLPIARAALKEGYDVLVATHVNESGGRISAEGFELLPIRLKRSGKNPLDEFLSILELIRLYRRVRPDIVHHIALKPVLYGAAAARLSGTRAIVNALAGLGHVFVAKGFAASAARFAASIALKWALSMKGAVTIFQNEDDLRLFVENRLAPRGRAVLIKGSGVDTNVFSPPEREPEGEPIVLLASRMLWTKGVGDFVEAARILKKKGVRARMVIAGVPDEHNPASIPAETLRGWGSEGIVEYWGGRDDMPAVLRGASVVALPSFYGEGVPKSLIEAASCARPIVAYDIPGCRDIARDGVNGLLAPPRDVTALAGAIERLLNDPGLRRAMGPAGRAIAEKEFSETQVTRETLALYEKTLARAGGR